ncbi:hypothetical protein BCR44DRAFT_1098062 [Catenaria anguillulae PL171]|uniref:Uncharacterized protein n=1 Tax=Catenaria anguillulae PL171 TaxID=765915 RepID=A0A1Y2I1D6_9FUNG|nr:hypothetical protein BCR44DRAFT_1098062 [Catenaria anguillulae PL171]
MTKMLVIWRPTCSTMALDAGRRHRCSGNIQYSALVSTRAGSMCIEAEQQITIPHSERKKKEGDGTEPDAGGPPYPPDE